MLELTTPTGGESWAAGSRHYVMWKANQPDADRTPRAEYTTDNGEHWVEVPALAADRGKILWPVPNSPSQQCRVRVFDQRSGASGESRDFAIVPSQGGDGYQWEKVTMQGPFAPRDGAGALVFNGRMWLLGGWNPSDKAHFPRITNNEVWSSKDGLNWDLVKPNTFLDRKFDPTSDWEGRHTAGYVVYKDKMWIVGGDANQGHYQYDVWNSADGKTWTLVNKDRKVPWGPRALHYTLVFKDKIWVMGGQTMPAFAQAEEAFYRDIWNTSDGVAWEKVTPKEPYWPARGATGGNVVFKDRMWILGGGTYDTPKTPERIFYNDVWSSPDGVQWECHTTMAPWGPREYHDVAVFDGRMWVLEGYKDGNKKDVWYSSDGVNWYELPGTPWTARHASSIFVHDNAIWVVVGNNMEPDVWKLQRHPVPAGATAPRSDAVDVGMLLNVAVSLKGLDDRVGFIYDAKNPDSPCRLVLYRKRTVTVPIFDNVFGLCFIDPQGKNAHAQFGADAEGGIRFDKWVDGGVGMEIVIDDKANPPTVTVKSSEK